MPHEPSPSPDAWPKLVSDLVARCSFPPAGSEVALAVSGGADSSALLVLAIAAGCAARVVHVDHGLRPESAREADVVAELASRFGVSFRSEVVAVGNGPNLEARARAARYAVLPDDVLTGHTLDDRAETMMLHLMRGTGLDGLAALGGQPSTRPLVWLRRRDTVAVCDALGIDPVADPSNQDPRFLRNRVRHELMPLLADIAGRDVAPLLARTGEVARRDVEALDVLADDLDPTDARALAVAPPALAVRALRRWLAQAHDGYAPGFDELARVLDVVHGTSVATELHGGWRVARHAQRLRLEAPPGPAHDG